MEERIKEKKSVTMQMAEYALCSHAGEFTEKDLRMIRLTFCDWLAAAVSGCGEKSAELLMEMARDEHAAGDCVLIGQGKTSSPLYAALINGTLSHAIDFDDIHDFLSLHLTSPVLPAALAAAQISGASGMELINGFVNGMQIMVALSAAVMPEHYNVGRFHATGTIGIFGAAAASGAILGLTPRQMCSAFGISAGLMSGIQLNFGTMAKPMAAGMAAKNGLMAALLAKKGFTGREDLFDTDFLTSLSAVAKADKMTERLTGPLGIHELRFKRYPCGAPTHSGIINCKKIIAEHGIKTEDIEKIIFEPYPRAIRLVGITHPKTGLEGKFSIPFTAAAQIVFGQVTMETFTDEAVRNPQIQYLLDRMEMVPNDEFTPSRGGRATIILKDGRRFSSSTFLLGHELDLDESEREVYEKYCEILIPRLGKDRSDAIYKEIKALEKAEDISRLCGLL